MDTKTIKHLALKYSSKELQQMADDFENGKPVAENTQADPGDQLSDFLQSFEVKKIMEDQGMDLQQALREFSKRVRSVLK